MADVMLTTIDNPFNPFTEFTSWLLFDVEKGYNTCSYLARIAEDSDSMSTIEEDKAIDKAMDEIIKNDPLNVYKKVYKQ